MPHKPKSDRRARLRNVLEILRLEDRFSLSQVKARLPSERPAFITRLVHGLVKEGLLQEDGRHEFRWTCPPAAFAMEAWLDGKVYAPRLAQTPEEDRPRERLLAHGATGARPSCWPS